MIGTVQPACPEAPKRGGKDHDGQEEEDPGDFKPEDSADSAEGEQKTAHAARKAPCNLARCLACGAVLFGRGGGWAGGHVGSGLGAGGDALAGDAPRDAHANTHSAADGVRFHSVMMVAVTFGLLVSCGLFAFCSCRRMRMEVR